MQAFGRNKNLAFNLQLLRYSQRSYALIFQNKICAKKVDRSILDTMN